MSEQRETAADELKTPLNEVEKAELMLACQVTMKDSGVLLLRRALFQIDSLTATVAKLQADLAALRKSYAAAIVRGIIRKHLGPAQAGTGGE